MLVTGTINSVAVVVRCTVFVWKNPDNYDPAVFSDYELQFSMQCMSIARCTTAVGIVVMMVRNLIMLDYNTFIDPLGV